VDLRETVGVNGAMILGGVGTTLAGLLMGERIGYGVGGWIVAVGMALTIWGFMLLDD